MTNENNTKTPYVFSTMADWLTPNSLLLNREPDKIINDLAVTQAFKNIYVDVPTVNTFQDPSVSISSLYGLQPKPNIEEQYNKIQEELSELTRTNNQERKERLKLQVENNQLKKQLVRAKSKAKSYKDELKLQNKFNQAEKDMNDLREENRQLREELSWREDHK
jgi:hypothetical protein